MTTGSSSPKPRRDTLGREALEHFFAGHRIIAGPSRDLGGAAGAFLRLTYRHVLDEAHVQWPLQRHLREAEQVLLERADHDDVELDRVEAHLEGGVEPGERVVELARRA